MKFRVSFSLTAFFLASACQASIAATAPATADPMTLLPANQRHTFAPAPKEWTVIKYPHLPSEPGREQISYYDKSGAEINDYRKSLLFRSDGSLETEIDRDPTGYYIRNFYFDGSVASYESRGKSGLIAAWSINPEGKSVSYFFDRNGDWIQWQEDKSSFTRDWYYDGNCYLSQTYKSGVIFRTQLSISQNGYLVINRDREDLTLQAQHEFWHKTLNQRVTAQIADYYGLVGDLSTGREPATMKYEFTDDEIKKRIREINRPQFHRRYEIAPALLQQLEADYLTRLADYEKFLTTTGQSWQSLKIESVLTPPK